MDNNNPEYIEKHPLFGQLVEQYEEEVQGACEYWRLAELASETGQNYLANGLYSISQQEMKHANFLREYLEHKEVYDPESHPEIESKWKNMLKRYGLR